MNVVFKVKMRNATADPNTAQPPNAIEPGSTDTKMCTALYTQSLPLHINPKPLHAAVAIAPHHPSLSFLSPSAAVSTIKSSLQISSHTLSFHPSLQL